MSNKKSNKKGQQNQQDRQLEQQAAMRKLDNTSLKEEIYQLKQQLSYSVQQKKQVEANIKQNNDKYMKDSFEIEKTVKVQQDQIVQLQNNQKLLKKSYEQARSKQRLQWQQQFEQLTQKKITEKQVLKNKIAQLVKKVNYLKNFNAREVQYSKSLNQLKTRQTNNKASQARDIEKIVAEHQSKRKQVQDAVTRDLENIKESEVSKLQQKMNRQQQIKRENQIIMQEIMLCESQKNLLEQQYKQLIQQNQGGKGSNTTSLLSGQASQTYQRSLRVIKLQNKLVKLKEHLAIETTRLEGQIKNAENHIENQKKSVENSMTKLQGWLKMKDKDLKKMKACAQMVLNQRSNLESYLLQVFHEHAELDSKDPTNVNTILRHLFVKINSRKPPMSYKDHLSVSRVSSIM